ncbi:MAG TPA: hypothetical protein VGQ58_04580 [Candidatus Limnocylindrales bacterium]|jgi:hypothetical protein|nr:hypothetical protein [Candidatus Limnocylindrales bacterium]
MRGSKILLLLALLCFVASFVGLELAGHPAWLAGLALMAAAGLVE